MKKRRAKRLSTINLQRDDSVVIQKKAKQLIDNTNRYLHVILTSKQDDCSQSTLNDLYRLNMTMASCAKYFKTAFIQYQARDNLDLRNELLHVALSCQKNLDTQS